MIEVTNLRKSFNKEEIIKGISFHLPKNGLAVIYGPSGCGKTTLLNCLSGLLPFLGDIVIDNKHINQMSENELNLFRLKNIGFVFQDFKLFENETVVNNILFPLEVISDTNNESKDRKCTELLKIVGLKSKKKDTVNKLSGGEKQRVAIARALINNPKVILADEPTGALDSNTAISIMDILENISKRSLVIIVSHDKELTDKYADIVINMSDGKLISIEEKYHEKQENNILIEKTLYSQKKPAIPYPFLFKHAYNSMKQKRWRTLICNLVTSLGLIGAGMAVTLSSSISGNIKKAYTSLIDQSKVMISLKEDNSIYGLYAGSYYEAIELKEEYDDYIYDVGADYIADFENYFPDTNCIALADTFGYQPIEGLSARHINEYKWLDVDKPNNIYPERVSELKEDEVVLGLSISMINDICFALRIERTVNSLSRYLIDNTLKIYFDLANDSWQYSDQQIVTVKGFSLEKNPCIYHYDHLWNEYMLETRMRFPTSDNLKSKDYYPWVMKKVYYLQLNTTNEEFLRFAHYKDSFDPYLLEIANVTYFPWLYVGVESKDVTRIMFLANTLDTISPRYVEYIQEVAPELSNPIYGTNGGYSIFPSSLMLGFSNYMYFSFHEESLTEVIDINTSLNVDTNEKSVLPDDVLSGHYSQSLNGGVNFSIIKNNLLYGRLPKNIDEIVISTEMLKKLSGSEAFTYPTIHVAYTISETAFEDGRVRRDFKTLDLNIVGIIEDDRNIIFQESDWLITFFQSRLGVSAYYLGVNTIAMDTDNEKEIDLTIKNLSKAFPNYSIVNPLSEINASIDRVCGYIEIALLCFSIIAVLISIMILTISNYLHIIESRKEIGLARCIGVNKKEAKKFLYAHSAILCIVSFVLSAIELVGLSLFISYILADNLGGGFSFSFNPFALLLMLVIAMVISIFSSLIMAHSISKIAPLEALKT